MKIHTHQQNYFNQNIQVEFTTTKINELELNLENSFKFKSYLNLVRNEESILKNNWYYLKDYILEFKGGPMGFHLHSYDYVSTGINLLEITKLIDVHLDKNLHYKYISQIKHKYVNRNPVGPPLNSMNYSLPQILPIFF